MPLLAIMAAVQVNSLLDETATWDEPVHITAGYSYWTTHQYTMNSEHPPLVKMLCALPLYLRWTLELDTTSPQWNSREYVHVGNEFLYKNTQSPDALLTSARLVNVALTLLFGLYLAWWTRRRFGPVIALFAVSLFAFDPNIIAHGRYVTTDAGVSLFIFTTCTLWIEFLVERRSVWLVLAGISFGLALACKYSALFLPPALVALYCLHAWWESSRVPIGKRGLDLVRYSAAMAALGIAVLAIVYLPEVIHRGELPPLAPVLGGEGKLAGYLAHTAQALDLKRYTFFVGLDRVLGHSASGHSAYLLGQFSDRGWWYYFPVAFAVKTPTGILLGLLLAAFVLARRYGRLDFLTAALLIPPLFYFGLSMTTRLNIGIRHLLPVYPFLYAAVGAVVAKHAWRRWALPAVVLLVVVESLAIYPNYLSFFNLPSGGPASGHRYLLDSNLDWGQGFRKLGRYMKQNGIERVCIASFANVDMPYYGVEYAGSPDDPDTADCVAAVSATPLYGLYTGPERFARLRVIKPTAIIAHSIYVYDLRKNPK